MPIRRGFDDVGRFATKLLEFRAASTTELVDAKWGSSDERVELIHEMEELVVQVESLIETLEEEPEDSEEAGRRAKPRLRRSQQHIGVTGPGELAGANQVLPMPPRWYAASTSCARRIGIGFLEGICPLSAVADEHGLVQQLPGGKRTGRFSIWSRSIACVNVQTTYLVSIQEAS